MKSMFVFHVSAQAIESMCWCKEDYHQTSNIRHTLVGNEILAHWDVVGALPFGTAPNTSSFLT